MSVVESKYPKDRLRLILAFDNADPKGYLYVQIVTELSGFRLSRKQIMELPNIVDLVFRGVVVTVCRFTHRGKRSTQAIAVRLVQKMLGYAGQSSQDSCNKSSSSDISVSLQKDPPPTPDSLKMYWQSEVSPNQVDESDNSYILLLDPEIYLEPRTIQRLVDSVKRCNGMASTGRLVYHPHLVQIWHMHDVDFLQSTLQDRALDNALGGATYMHGGLSLISAKLAKEMQGTYFDMPKMPPVRWPLFLFTRGHMGADRYQALSGLEAKSVKGFKVKFVEDAVGVVMPPVNWKMPIFSFVRLFQTCFKPISLLQYTLIFALILTAQPLLYVLLATFVPLLLNWLTLIHFYTPQYGFKAMLYPLTYIIAPFTSLSVAFFSLCTSSKRSVASASAKGTQSKEGTPTASMMDIRPQEAGGKDGGEDYTEYNIIGMYAKEGDVGDMNIKGHNDIHDFVLKPALASSSPSLNGRNGETKTSSMSLNSIKTSGLRKVQFGGVGPNADSPFVDKMYLGDMDFGGQNVISTPLPSPPTHKKQVVDDDKLLKPVPPRPTIRIDMASIENMPDRTGDIDVEINWSARPDGKTERKVVIPPHIIGYIDTIVNKLNEEEQQQQQQRHGHKQFKNRKSTEPSSPSFMYPDEMNSERSSSVSFWRRSYSPTRDQQTSPSSNYSKGSSPQDPAALDKVVSSNMDHPSIASTPPQLSPPPSLVESHGGSEGRSRPSSISFVESPPRSLMGSTAGGGSRPPSPLRHMTSFTLPPLLRRDGEGSPLSFDSAESKATLTVGGTKVGRRGAIFGNIGGSQSRSPTIRRSYQTDVSGLVDPDDELDVASMSIHSEKSDWWENFVQDGRTDGLFPRESYISHESEKSHSKRYI
ncbi:hypothetical protein HDV05_003838 [Chytridiales sp. JEL 0842]|nr:hypothetical protein HDV05_003838 [Chytridiales sp. JEL 0842]